MGWVANISAQTNLLLIQYTNLWRYNQSGSNLLTAWKERTYNDAPAPWDQGLGLLGIEPGNPGNYPFPFQTTLAEPSVSGVITVYFRTHFNYPANLSRTGVVMTASHYLDDGAVFYLNGVELYRYRVPTNQIYTTQADAQPAAEGTNEVITFTVAATNLLAGDNVVAAELHQNGTASSDAVFGMRLEAAVPVALAITNQPDSITIQAGKPATFSVGVSGGPAYYRWFTNGPSGFVQIPGAAGTNFASYATTSATTTNMSGIQYRVVVTNVLNSATSTVAVLSVVPDVFGPRLVEAVITNNNQVHILFDEPVTKPAATNHTNYAITIFGMTNRIAVSNNVIGHAGEVIRLTMVTNLDPAVCYLLTVNNVGDSFRFPTNFIPPNSQITISSYSTNAFVELNQTWKWNEDGVDLGTAWRQRTYDDNIPGWGTGQGAVVYDQSPAFVLCMGTANTVPSLGVVTYYFRTYVTSSRAGEASLRLRYTVDDGAVFYLNGVELPGTRVNLPAGQISATTLATPEVGDATCSALITVTVTNLLLGDNVVAVELHQFAADNDNDIVLGLQIDGIFLNSCTLTNPPAPRLYITRATPNVNLRFTNGPAHTTTNNGFALEYADKVTGPWLEVQPPMRNSTNIPTSRAAQFYRLRRYTNSP